MQQEEVTLSAILDTRNESAVNDSSFPPLLCRRYTVSLIRTAATESRILVTSFFPLLFPIEEDNCFSGFSLLSVIGEDATLRKSEQRIIEINHSRLYYIFVALILLRRETNRYYFHERIWWINNQSRL